ncbi:MAG: ATP-binding cassette domain-containing protein, partial [Gemmatimonadota bacterium]|nr:ATP-binding cassette domain-containing protein [Gemmatimonadota bacterium]
MTPAVRLRGVTKRFGAVRALEGVDFELAPGEIHGLLGENGAGKTTLARVVAGLLAPDAGHVEIGGREVRLGSAAEARALGVAMVHQHFSLVPRFSGFENVVLFNAEAWTPRGGVRTGYRERIEARAAELGLPVALDVPVERLGVADRQRIEILKALMGETRVLLLDEPTAVLAPQEVTGLFTVLRRVAAAGTGIVLVAHKLDEVLAAADRVTVLRRGRWVLTRGAGGGAAGGGAGALGGGGRAGGRSRHGGATEEA